MQQIIELVVLLVAVVFAWRRTAARHIKQGRGTFAAHIGGLGAGITALVVVMGLIVLFDPPPSLSGKATQPIQAKPMPATNVEPAKGQ